MAGKLVFVLLISAVLWDASISAESRPAISLGMSLSEVLSLRGSPLEKTEYESMRTESWRYADGTLLFRAGRVALMDASMGRKSEAQLNAKVSSQRTGSHTESGAAGMFVLKAQDRGQEMKGVLDEILKAIPSEDGSKSAPAAPPGMMGMPPVEIIKAGP